MSVRIIITDTDISDLKDGAIFRKDGEEFAYEDYWDEDIGAYVVFDSDIESLYRGRVLDFEGSVKLIHEDYATQDNGGSPTDVLDELKEVFEEKNDDYGNSWEKVGVIKRVMADEEGPQLVELDDGREAVLLADTPQKTSAFEENADDVITRLLDKLIRAYNLCLMKDEPALDNESTEDAAKDLTGYSSMLTSLIRRQ